MKNLSLLPLRNMVESNKGENKMIEILILKLIVMNV